jgi:hypothetical protein
MTLRSANIMRLGFAAVVASGLSFTMATAYAQKGHGGGGHESGGESGGCSSGGGCGDEGGSEGHEGGSMGQRGPRGGPGGVAGSGGRGQSLRGIFHGLDSGSSSEEHSGAKHQPR